MDDFCWRNSASIFSPLGGLMTEPRCLIDLSHQRSSASLLWEEQRWVQELLSWRDNLVKLRFDSVKCVKQRARVRFPSRSRSRKPNNKNTKQTPLRRSPLASVRTPKHCRNLFPLACQSTTSSCKSNFRSSHAAATRKKLWRLLRPRCAKKIHQSTWSDVHLRIYWRWCTLPSPYVPRNRKKRITFFIKVWTTTFSAHLFSDPTT